MFKFLRRKIKIFEDEFENELKSELEKEQKNIGKIESNEIQDEILKKDDSERITDEKLSLPKLKDIKKKLKHISKLHKRKANLKEQN